MLTRKMAAIAGGAGVAVGVAAVGWAAWWEPRRLVIRRLSLSPPGWPADLSGLRLGLIGDLHAGGPHVDVRRVRGVVETMNAQAPDLVALVGDFVDPEVALGGRISPTEVAQRLAGLQAPAFAVLGNHDHSYGGGEVARALNTAGVRVLEDDAASQAMRGGRLWIAGAGDVSSRGADLDRTLAPVASGEPVVLLSHSPDVFPQVPARVAVTLSGHTHGGQVNLPLLRRWAIPSRHDERYAAGHVMEGDRHLFVTAGVGSAHAPVRFRRPPEIAVLELRSGDGRAG